MKLRYHAIGLTAVALMFQGKIIAQDLGPEKIAENAYKSVVTLFNEDANGNPVALGSGFFVADSIIATNFHVINNAANMEAKPIGSENKYKISGILAIDRLRDLSLLKIEGITAPPLALSDSSGVAVGNEVYAVGSPEGLEGTFSKGIISAIRSKGSDSIIQIDAAVWHGSSGGPVLNKYGHVVGVVAAGSEQGQNLNFAIAVCHLTSLMLNIKPIVPLSINMIISYGQGILAYDDLSDSDPILLVFHRKAGFSQKIYLSDISFTSSSIENIQKQYDPLQISVVGWSNKIQDSPNPIWNQSFPIFDYELGDEIMILVYDQDMTKLQFIGFAKIEEPVTNQYPILRPMGNGQYMNQGVLAVNF